LAHDEFKPHRLNREVCSDKNDFHPANLKNHRHNYNTLLSTADGLAAELQTDEKNLDALSGTMLASVGVKYGKNSAEYGKAGGTRTADRKKIVRKANVATAKAQAKA
jgi:hypothetical protein